MKKQKVRFSRNDKRPAKYNYKLSYEKKLVKKGKKILWHVIEKPTNQIVSEFFFEEDADKLAKFQNKYDEASDYSRDYEAQKKWELLVEEQLEALKDFAL